MNPLISAASVIAAGLAVGLASIGPRLEDKELKQKSLSCVQAGNTREERRNQLTHTASCFMP